MADKTGDTGRYDFSIPQLLYGQAPYSVDPYKNTGGDWTGPILPPPLEIHPPPHHPGGGDIIRNSASMQRPGGNMILNTNNVFDPNDPSGSSGYQTPNSPSSGGGYNPGFNTPLPGNGQGVNGSQFNFGGQSYGQMGSYNQGGTGSSWGQSNPQQTGGILPQQNGPFGTYSGQGGGQNWGTPVNNPTATGGYQPLIGSNGQLNLPGQGQGGQGGNFSGGGSDGANSGGGGPSDMGAARTQQEAARNASLLQTMNQQLPTLFYNLIATNPGNPMGAVQQMLSSPYYAGIAQNPQIQQQLQQLNQQYQTFQRQHPGASIGSYGSNVPAGTGPQQDTWGYNPNTHNLENMWNAAPGGGVTMPGQTPAASGGAGTPPTAAPNPTTAATTPHLPTEQVHNIQPGQNGGGNQNWQSILGALLPGLFGGGGGQQGGGNWNSPYGGGGNQFLGFPPQGGGGYQPGFGPNPTPYTGFNRTPGYQGGGGQFGQSNNNADRPMPGYTMQNTPFYLHTDPNSSTMATGYVANPNISGSQQTLDQWRTANQNWSNQQQTNQQNFAVQYGQQHGWTAPTTNPSDGTGLTPWMMLPQNFREDAVHATGAPQWQQYSGPSLMDMWGQTGNQSSAGGGSSSTPGTQMNNVSGQSGPTTGYPNNSWVPQSQTFSMPQTDFSSLFSGNGQAQPNAQNGGSGQTQPAFNPMNPWANTGNRQPTFGGSLGSMWGAGPSSGAFRPTWQGNGTGSGVSNYGAPNYGTVGYGSPMGGAQNMNFRTPGGNYLNGGY